MAWPDTVNSSLNLRVAIPQFVIGQYRLSDLLCRAKLHRCTLPSVMAWPVVLSPVVHSYHSSNASGGSVPAGIASALWKTSIIAI